MKKPALLFASLLGITLLAPLSAQAGRGGYDRDCDRGGYTRVTYDDCGRPVRMVRVYQGRDCHGYPVYRWVREVRHVRPVRRERDCDYGHHDRRHSRARGGITIRIGG